jgi:hypothetical protein
MRSLLAAIVDDDRDTVGDLLTADPGLTSRLIPSPKLYDDGDPFIPAASPPAPSYLPSRAGVSP